MNSFTLEELAEKVDAQVLGDRNTQVMGVSSIVNSVSGTVTYLSDSSHSSLLATLRATAIILRKSDAHQSSIPCLMVENPEYAYAKIAALFVRRLQVEPGIHPTAIVPASCDIAATASIGPFCILGEGVQVGDRSIIAGHTCLGDNTRVGADTCLHDQVKIYHDVVIGDRCHLYSGVVIGADGFGYLLWQGKQEKIPQLGRVMIGNDVDIGANTTIDRGAIENTIIADGVKIDNQVQIAHNVEIGEHTVIAACVGISGSTKIGRYCQIAGGVGFNGHLTITDYVVVIGMSRILHSISTPGVYGSGTIEQPLSQWKRNMIKLQDFYQFSKRVRQLEKKENG